jgi:hypothetical protein
MNRENPESFENPNTLFAKAASQNVSLISKLE